MNPEFYPAFDGPEGLSQAGRHTDRLNLLRDTVHRLVENACHDMRTPVTVVKAFAAILLEEAREQIGSEHGRILQTMASRAEELARMIDGMADLSRAEAELFVADRSRIPVDELVKRVQPALEALAAEHRVRLAFAVDGLPAVFCDGEQIGRVIHDLTAHTIRCAGEGGEVTLRAEATPATGEVRILIADTRAAPAIAANPLTPVDRARPLEGAAGPKRFLRDLFVASELVRLNLGELSASSSAAGNAFAFGLPTDQLANLIPRFVQMVRSSRRRPPTVALATAAPASASAAGGREAFRQALAGLLSSTDLVLPTERGETILCLACEDPDAAVERLRTDFVRPDRASASGQTPAIRLAGSWAASGDPEELLAAVRRLCQAERPAAQPVGLEGVAPAAPAAAPRPRAPRIDGAPAPRREMEVQDHAPPLPSRRAAAADTGEVPRSLFDRPRATHVRSDDMTANRKILIADDDPTILRSLAGRCEKLGLEVITATNGLQAILKATRNPPRLLILDVNMPEADGFRVCEWLLDGKRPPVDVVMLTGRADLDTMDRCDSFGTYHVPKGAETWSMLRSILAEVLGIEDEALAGFAPEQVDQTRRLLVDKRGNKVLIVEDDADLGFALERRLKKCGAVTLRASNGIEGYRLALSEKPDVVVTDYMMPDAGGHYMIWRLKSTEETKHIPVVVITGQRLMMGRDIPLENEEDGAVGAVRYFEKPLDLDALFHELSRHCAIEYKSFAPAGA